jgi:glycosyltransferase involved in cell wall biosynthesis
VDTARPQAVLFLLSALGLGGSEGKIVRLANSIAARGNRVVLAYLNEPADLLAEVAPAVTVVNLHCRGGLSLGALKRLIDVIRVHDVGTVLSVNLYASLFAWLARLRLGRKRFRMLASVNTTEFVTRAESRRMLLYRHALAAADVVIFGAETQRKLWRDRYGIGLRPGRAAVLYNGVDIARFEAGSRLDRQPTCVLEATHVIGTVGRLRPEKAHGVLIEAVAELRRRGLDVGALIVGDGPERARLETEISRLALQPHVHLAGATRDVRPYLATMDVFVVTSVTETFSNAALEAMASGLPVVSSAVGGMPELVAFGGGVTYRSGDVKELADRLEDLLRDPRKRADMGQEARRATIEHFSWTGMVEAFSALLVTSGIAETAAPSARAPRQA